jgi:predicted nucleic acid-binding protein
MPGRPVRTAARGEDHVLRLCLDLNVWVADLLAIRRGRVGSLAQALVDALRDGTCSLGPVQLIVSWGMLDRLHTVLTRELAMPPDVAATLIASIATLADVGPAGTSPYLVLGGAGVIPVRDEEDRGVLETAFAGRAHVLVTANFRDFAGGDAVVRSARKIATVKRGVRELVIATPQTMVAWIRAGEIRLP